MALTLLLTIVIGVLALYIAGKIFRNQKNVALLPPGPKGKPIIGNLLDLPAPGTQEWQHWLKHKDLYGPVSSVTIFGQTIIIINDSQAAFEILERRSAKNSSRPHLVFANELGGWGKAPSNQDNTRLLRTYRKAIARVFGSRAEASKFDDLQEVEVRRFLRRLLENPKNFVDHLRTEAGAFILKLTYGYVVEPQTGDPLVDLAELALNQFSKAVVPGAWLVDMIPALKHLPEWCPGTGFKEVGRKYFQTLTDLVEKPFAFTKYQMAHERHRPSFVSNLLEQGEDEDIVKWSSLAMYSAGADTTVSALKGFFLALTLYPEVQQKAQAEIDSVIGTNRLPSTTDRDNLPYVNAIVKEALRWHTVTPLGLPHKADEDDIFDGFLIPKGALLLPNVWAYNNDPKVYPQPAEFNPDRFIARDGHDPEPDPHNVSFGFGRRICPGRLIADTTLFLNIAQSLATFTITKGVGEDGREIRPHVYFEPGMICHPAPYQCTFIPRSAQHEELIRVVEKEHPLEKSDAETLENVKY